MKIGKLSKQFKGKTKNKNRNRKLNNNNNKKNQTKISEKVITKIKNIKKSLLKINNAKSFKKNEENISTILKSNIAMNMSINNINNSLNNISSNKQIINEIGNIKQSNIIGNIPKDAIINKIVDSINNKDIDKSLQQDTPEIEIDSKNKMEIHKEINLIIDNNTLKSDINSLLEKTIIDSSKSKAENLNKNPELIKIKNEEILLKMNSIENGNSTPENELNNVMVSNENKEVNDDKIDKIIPFDKDKDTLNIQSELNEKDISNNKTNSNNSSEVKIEMQSTNPENNEISKTDLNKIEKPDNFDNNINISNYATNNNNMSLVVEIDSFKINNSKGEINSKQLNSIINTEKEDNTSNSLEKNKVDKNEREMKEKKVDSKNSETITKNSNKNKKEINSENREILHLRNLSKQTTEKDILSNFEIIGEIEEFHYLTRLANINEGIIIYKFKGCCEEAIQLMRNVKINGKLCKIKMIDEKEKDSLLEKENKSAVTRRSTRIRKSSETEKTNNIDNKLKSPKKETSSTSNKNESPKKVTAGTKRKTLENSDSLESTQSSKKAANDTFIKSNNNENNGTAKVVTTTANNKRKTPDEIETTKRATKRKAVEKKDTTDGTPAEPEITNDPTKQSKTKTKTKSKSTSESTKNKSHGGKIIKFFFIKRIVMNQVVTIYSILEKYGNILSFEYIKNKKFEGLWYVIPTLIFILLNF
ncbi:hypothetical protein PIROE2DRAFT_10440 [Piromyces sp. E2]|nr:hypothetical protein PIROE2DRAFT_10440 [Piromyces sp. E2]|eukprot:OUM63085.1 hypothetical protein PIROE2DRAFT_10440 [Piromyces sp. E2]